MSEGITRREVLKAALASPLSDKLQFVADSFFTRVEQETRIDKLKFVGHFCYIRGRYHCDC